MFYVGSGKHVIHKRPWCSVVPRVHSQRQIVVHGLSPRGSYTNHAAGELHGLTRIWAVDGTLIEEAVYLEGRKTGPARTWYSSGSAQSEGRFEGGARHGRWIYWRKDGALNEAWSGLYEDDVRVAPLDASDPALQDS